MNARINIIIVDDHIILRDGLKAIFSVTPKYNVVGDTGSEVQLFNLLEANEVDIILLDIHLINNYGLDLAVSIKNKYPAVKVLMHTMSADEYNIQKAHKIGADGYILKSSGQSELEKAIDMVYLGGKYFPSTIS